MLPVDCKRWSKPSDARLNSKIEHSVSNKTNRIKRAFGKEAVPMYINLIGNSNGSRRALETGESYFLFNLFIEKDGRAVLNLNLIKQMRSILDAV